MKDETPVAPALPKPDSVHTIAPLHPATLKLHEGMLRAVKTAIGVWEAWLRERQR